MAQDEPDWRKYERHIYEKLKEAGGSDSTVEFDHALEGRFSKTRRQVDAVATGKYADGIEKDVTAAVDCKFYSRNVDVKDVEAFIGLVDDVGADLGILITTKGYSKAAEQRARNGARGIRLRTIPPVLISDPDDLPRVYFPSFDEPYYSGEFWEQGMHGDPGALIRYSYPEEYPYTLEHPGDLEWSDEVLASDSIELLNWSTDDERANCALIMLRHYLGQEPEDEDVEIFLHEFGAELEDGQLWAIYLGEIRAKTGLRANIKSEEMMEDLEYELEIEVLALCDEWDKLGIHTAAIRGGLERDGAVATVRRYGAGRKIEGYQEGLKKALEALGPDGTMEGLIDSDRFRQLFNVTDIATARSKLEDPG